MQRIVTAVSSAQFHAADANSIQDQAASISPATGKVASVATTIAAGSNGVNLAGAATINVASTAGFTTTGTITVLTTTGLYVIAYTGLNAGTQFTGCNITVLGTPAGVMGTGNAVTQCSNGLFGVPQGLDSRAWIYGFTPITAGGLAAHSLIHVDDSIDWHDRIIYAQYSDIADIAGCPGGANDVQFGNVLHSVSTARGYLGKGGQKAGGGQVTNANVPSPASGLSWAVQIATNIWLYADSFDSYKLKFFNDTAAPLTCPELRVWFTAQLGRRT